MRFSKSILDAIEVTLKWAGWVLPHFLTNLAVWRLTPKRVPLALRLCVFYELVMC